MISESQDCWDSFNVVNIFPKLFEKEILKNDANFTKNNVVLNYRAAFSIVQSLKLTKSLWIT